MNTLEEIRDSDFDSVLRINSAGHPGIAGLSRDEIVHLRQLATMFSVLRERDTCVGYVIAYDRSKPYDGEEFIWFKGNLSEEFLYIDQIAIDQDSRGTGLGTKIYAALKGFAARRNFVSLVCEVNIEPPNPVSFSFHTKNGFKEIDRLKVSDGRFVSLMKAQLQ